MEWTNIGFANTVDRTAVCCKACCKWHLNWAVGLGLMMKIVDCAVLRLWTWYMHVCRMRQGLPRLTSFSSAYLKIHPNSDVLIQQCFPMIKRWVSNSPTLSAVSTNLDEPVNPSSVGRYRSRKHDSKCKNPTLRLYCSMSRTIISELTLTGAHVSFWCR